MYLEFVVVNQVLTNTVYRTVASGSEGYLKAKFEFSDDWDDVNKVAQFKTKPSAVPYEKVLVNGECDIPPEVIARQGYFWVAVRGSNDEGKKPTTKVIKLKVEEGAVPSGQLPSEPTLSLADQILNIANEALSVAQSGGGTGGTNGQDGQDGFSPTATVTKSGDTVTITITDKNGTTTETITDGGGTGTNGLLFENWLGNEEVSLGTEEQTNDTIPPILTITPNGTNFSTSQTVIMSVNETSDIYYTLDGSTPTISSEKYTNPINLNDTTTLKAFAKDLVGNASAVQTVVFTKAATDTTPPTVNASFASGEYTSTISVSLNSNEPATIYYTLDGSTPTISSAVYSSPITINKETTLKFFAKDTVGNVSAVKTENYSIVVFYDTFTRADSETLGVTELGNKTWIEPTSYDGLAIYGNKVKCNTSGLIRHAVIDSGVSDYEVSCDVTFGTYAGIFFRYGSNSDNTFFFKTGLGDTRLGAYKNSSTSVSLGTNPFVPTTGQLIKLKVRKQGSNIKCYIDGTLYFDINDTFDTGGNKVGLVLHNDNTSLIDNFKGFAI